MIIGAINNMIRLTNQSIILKSISALREGVATTLPAGFYCNVYASDFADGRCAGESVAIGSDGAR